MSKTRKGPPAPPKPRKCRQAFTVQPETVLLYEGDGFRAELAVEVVQTKNGGCKPLSIVLSVSPGTPRRLYYSNHAWLLSALPRIFRERMPAEGVSCLHQAIADAVGEAKLVLLASPFTLFPTSGFAVRASSKPEVLTKSRLAVLASKPPPEISRTLWAALVRRDRGSCICCDTTLSHDSGASYHHLLPRAEGGKDELDNLVLTCQACHDRLEISQEAAL